jgi:hypothetical protein
MWTHFLAEFVHLQLQLSVALVTISSLKSNPGMGDCVVTSAKPLAPRDFAETMTQVICCSPRLQRCMLMPGQGAFRLGASPLFPLPSKGEKGFELVVKIMFRGGSRDEAEAALRASQSPLAKC